MTDTRPRHLEQNFGSGAPISETRSNRKGSSAGREIVETVLIALLIFVLVRTFVLNFKVDGESMMPTFASGEMLLVNRNAYRAIDAWDFVDWLPGVEERNTTPVLDFGSPVRGDVVVFTPPEPGQQKPYIKRVIGLPGDEIEVREHGVYINGVRLEEGYVDDPKNRCDAGWRYCGTVTVTVPDGSVYVLGDNRGNSQDSRFFGVVPEDNIIGKAWVVYWPDDVWGTVDHEEYPELGP